jgi:hypothetical protein
MKRISATLFFLGLFTMTTAVSQAIEMGPAAGVPEAVDKDQLEGWITSVDYRSSDFRLLDPRGFQRRVTAKPGTIGDYRLGDRVRVIIDPDYDRAESIEKLY